MGKMKCLLVRFGCLFGFVVLGSIVMSSCATGGGGGPAPVPNNRMARLSNAKMDTLNIGYQTYQGHCVRCHTEQVPNPPVGRPWHPASLGLSLYSSLSSQQRYGVQQYMKAVERARFKVQTGSLQDVR